MSRPWPARPRWPGARAARDHLGVAPVGRHVRPEREDKVAGGGAAVHDEKRVVLLGLQVRLGRGGFAGRPPR